MNRLQSELHRLYFPDPAAASGPELAASGLIDPQGRVRAMVLELARPASWELLSAVWRGVQSELELPAPAIAVSGTDGHQLWFSLAEPVPVGQAHAFLESLRLRFLPDVAAKRVCLMPAPESSTTGEVQHARMVPALQAQTGNWSAFLAPDLAPVFDDTPWLDIPPGEQGQADLLSRLGSIPPDAFEAALEKLRPVEAHRQQDAVTPEAVDPRPGSGSAGAVTPAVCLDPKRFLLQVMNDEAVALALRIDAAKALLPYADDLHPGPGSRSVCTGDSEAAGRIG